MPHFKSSKRWGIRAILSGLVVLFFAGHLGTQTALTPGRVVGDISFINVTPETAAYLAANPAAPWTSTDPYLHPVRLYHVLNSNRSAASAYAPVNAAPDGQTYLAANFDINPSVGPGRRDFVLEINALKLSNGARYVFGSREPLSPFYRLCLNVQSLADDPDGTRCDISECAVLLPLRLRFGGTEENKNAVDDAYPAVCRAAAYVKENPGSEDLVLQAESETKQFSVDSLKTSEGVILPILIRAAGSVMWISVECGVKIKEGESGFPVNPSTGTTPLNTRVQIGPFACGAPSPAVLDVEIPTDRTAGMVQGLFDVSGHAETTAEVRIGDLSWYYRTTPQPIPPGSVPTVPWKFQGVPEGSREVYAWAALDGGKSVLEFPHLDSYNQRVSVVRLQTEDLGATFVAKPTVVRGNVVLVDPGGLTDLDGIQTHPLSELSGYEKSFMLAEGVDQRASNTPDCVNRSSGTKGRSLGRLTGAYDPAQHRADMSYELLLAGLSPRQASPDGIGACPAPWNMAGLSTSLITVTDPPHSGKCSFLLKLGQYFPLLADVNAEPVLFPDQKICFGKIRLDYHVNSSLGSIYYPYLYLRQSGVDVGPNVFGTAYSLGTGNAYGTPLLASESGPTASVTATLPEGLRYKIDPMIYFLPAGQTSGQGTYLYLDTIVLPETGFVGCGDVLSACLSLLDEQGNYSLLSIGFPSVTEYCLTGGDLILDFNVHLTDGGDVALVGYVLDPDNAETADLSDPNAVILCPSDCGPNPSYGLGLSGLSVGPHALKIIAVAANGCRAGRIYHFHVQSQPLTIQCSEDITVDLLPNETGISNDDPRIAGRLNAASSGGCGLPLTIGDDVPDHFPIGQTTVSFWIQGHEEISCQTTVTVAPADRILSFICRDPASGEQVIRKRTFRDDSLDTVTYSHPQPFHFEYGRDGSRMAVIPDGTGAVKIIDTATNTTASLFPVPADAKLYDIDFHPLDLSTYVLVGSAVANPDQHSLYICRGGELLSRFDLPLFAPGIRISRPLVAWSPDGTKISASFTDPAPAVNQYGLWVTEWNVQADRIVLPPNGMFEMRPNLQNRETLRETVYQDGDWRAVATNMTINRAVKRPGTEQMVPLWAAPNIDLDLTPDGQAAAFLRRFPSESLLPSQVVAVKVYAARPLDGSQIPNVIEGPLIDNGRSVAVSSDGAYVAVAADDKVLVYKLPDFSLVKEISAVSPRNLEFKPF